MKKTLLLILLFSCLQINAQCWKSIAAGSDYTVALATDGFLWAWGNNQQGQLGDGTFTKSKIAKKIGTANDWKVMDAGQAFAVAIKTDGTLWAWGDNYYGQLCDGTNIDSPIPVQIGTANDWQAISTGNSFILALKTDGTLWAWGDNHDGQLGDGTTTNKNIPTQIGTANDWQAIETGYSHCLVIKKDGTLWAWGGNSNGQVGDNTTTNVFIPKKIGTATDWKTISTGYHHTMGIKIDGTLWGWGESAYGNLGSGFKSDYYVPTKIGTLNDWKNVAVGGDQTIAIKTDGSLWAWGYNSDGQLGNATNTNSLVPIKIENSNNWKAISAGYFHSVALNTDNSIFVSGRNSDGQLGDNTYTSKNALTLVGCPGMLTLATFKADISCFGDNNGSASITTVTGGTSPYTYLWSNGKTTSSITGLTPGEYSCNVTDAASLSITKSFTVTQPTPLNLILTSTNASCNTNEIIITAIASGGTQPYKYSISSGSFQDSNIFTGLASGNYNVMVRDNNGCIYTTIININSNNTVPPTANAQTFNSIATVADLKAAGSNLLWYSVPAGGTALNLSTVLQTGTYYVSQTINGCESLTRALVTVIITIPSGNEQIPTTGLIAHYPFNGNANDTSGNGANGTVTAAILTSDRFGNSNSAYSFDGINSYIDAVISNIPKSDSPRTISGWFKTNDAFTDPNKYDASIFNYGTLAKLQRLSLSVYRKGYLDLISGTTSSTDDYYIDNFDYANNDWYFFTVTYDGSKLSIYVNGKYVNQKAVSLNTVGNVFRIGQRISGDTVKEGFKGTIDDIAIWNRVLTPEEISAMYVPATTNNYTVIPDANFEKKLIDLGIDSGVADGKVLTSNISTVKFLDLTKSNISDLTGIQDFVSLTDLYCSQNSLTTINISKNIALTTLDCSNNRITSLDVSNNIALLNLSCYSNQLTALDVKVNTALKKLDSGSNKYTALDVSSNTALTFLGCNTSLLTSLDVSNNTALNLLDCRENKLTQLDVSKITTLTELYCQSNQLTSLNISENKALEFVNCSKNQLTTLDVSVNTALVGLYCSSNQLTSLNLKNANNVKFAYLNLINNPNLTCIQVDDVAYANTNWSAKKDTIANYSLDCVPSFVAIPDQNFEQKLIDLGIDTDGLNGKITAANISGITVLDLSNSNISNLSGIENFTSLTYLDVSNNNLKTLDVSNNGFLETLNASSNQLTTLDVSKNTKLRIIYVANNPLLSINLKNGNNRNFILPVQTGKKSAAPLYTTFIGLTTLSCIQVDDEAYSNANWSNIKEPNTTYSNTCKNLGITDSVFAKATIYPNPTSGEVNILNITLEQANVYNELGQLVKTFTLNSNHTNNTINLSGLPKGVYYIYLINQDAASAKKVIVE